MIQGTLTEVNKVVEKFRSDRLMIMVSPGTIRNNGKRIEVLLVVIGDKHLKKLHQQIYRDLPSNFERWLGKQVDAIKST